MVDYQGNPNKAKEPRPDKQIVKVVTGEVIQKEPGIGRKFKNVFFGGDLNTSLRFVYADVLLPAARSMISDAVRNVVDGILWGENRRRAAPDYRPRVSYNNPLNRDNVRHINERRIYLPDQPPKYIQRDRARVDLNDIILARKEDAELVVERLIDIVNQFDVASVADLYDLLGLTSSYTDNSYGWTRLNTVEIRQRGDGYIIDLPPVEML